MIINASFLLLTSLLPLAWTFLLLSMRFGCSEPGYSLLESHLWGPETLQEQDGKEQLRRQRCKEHKTSSTGRKSCLKKFLPLPSMSETSDRKGIETEWWILRSCTLLPPSNYCLHLQGRINEVNYIYTKSLGWVNYLDLLK